MIEIISTRDENVRISVELFSVNHKRVLNIGRFEPITSVVGIAVSRCGLISGRGDQIASFERRLGRFVGRFDFNFNVTIVANDRFGRKFIRAGCFRRRCRIDTIIRRLI